MAFWNTNNIHPKTKHKFILVIGGFQVLTVKTVKKPKASIDTKEFLLVNHYYKYPGLLKWEPITITFADMYGDKGSGTSVQNTALNTAKYLRKLLADSGYKTPNNTGLTTPEKASSIDRAFGSSTANSTVKSEAILTIQQVDPTGKNVVEQWSLVNPIITEIDWGQLDYSSSDTVEYSMTVAYDYALFDDEAATLASGPETGITL